MKHKCVISFVCGAVIFGTAGVVIGRYVTIKNPFPIQLDGENIALEGYNINNNTYFKLRDIADAVGGFSVDFQNDTIQLAKEENVKEPSAAAADYSKYVGDFYITPEPDGRYWFGYELKIDYIDGTTVNFDYQHPKSGQAFYYTANPATFINDTTAVATGTCTLGGEPDSADATSDVEYTLVFEGDTVSITAKHIKWNSENNNSFNVYNDLESNYDL